MRLVLQILVKDLRRHWREIALFVCCCCGWAWERMHQGGWIWTHQRETLPVALFGLWLLITVRAVHGECLVGDREFWQTRPYTWTQLLSAKVLFLVLCLNVPLLLAQVALLAWAGIPLSLSLVPGLLLLQLEFVVMVTFPAWVLAAVTESLVQWVLAVVGLGIFALFLSSLPWDRLPKTLAGEETVATMLGGAIIIPALLFALVWQYGRRRVWLARIAIAFAALMVPLVILIAPGSMVRSIAYEPSTGTVPFQFSLREAGDEKEHTYIRKKGLFEEDTLRVPINFGSTDTDLNLAVEGFRIVLKGDNGWRWESPWMNQTVGGDAYWGGTFFQFDMPRELADQLQKVRAEATVELAYRVNKLERLQKVDTRRDTYSITGGAYCHWFSSTAGRFLLSGDTCVAPLQLPGVVIAQIDSRDFNCRVEKGEMAIPANHYASSVNTGGDTIFPDFDPDPIRTLSLNFGDWVPAIKSTLNPKSDRSADLCRGMPLYVRIGRYSGRLRSIVNLGPLGNEKPIRRQ